MRNGLLSGLLWALNTIVLGIALEMSPFCDTKHAIFLAPFISTFLNDFFSSMFMFIYNGIKHQTKQTFKTLCSKAGLWIVAASILGGPIGMTGYVLSISYMGSSIAAVASAIYPAIGALCARIFLKDKMKWYQYIFLGVVIIGIYCISYSPDIEIKNFLLGVLGTVMCSVGWGLEAVLIAKGLKNVEVNSDVALHIRQTTSWVVYAIILIPILRAWPFTVNLFDVTETKWLIPCIMFAAVFGTTSYLCYYKSINEIGAAKAMSLNVTYVAWAVILSLVFYRNFSDYSWLTYICIVVIFVASIFAAADFKEIFRRNQNERLE